MSDAKINPEAIKHREALRAARLAYYQGTGSLTDLEQAADDYITFLKKYRQESGKRFRIPTRAYLIRAI